MAKTFKQLQQNRAKKLRKVAILAALVLLTLVVLHLENEDDTSWASRVVSTTSTLEADIFFRFGQLPVPGPTCTEPRGAECRAIGSTNTSTLKGRNIYTCDHQCSKHSTCYLGTCLCHPGYQGPHCQDKMKVANPWYTADCPNLQDDDNTLDVHRTQLGGTVDCPNLAHDADLGTGLSYCAYLCYSNELYGSAIVPHALWEKAQQAENTLWKKIRHRGPYNDRYKDHFQGFAQYHCLPEQQLGHVVEFGAGPWTQFRGLLSLRPNTTVESYTVLEPGANFYMENVTSCAYKTGRLTMYPDTSKFHDFPIHIQSSLGESAMATNYQFDTVMVVNVIEHVQSAVDFLHGIHKSLKPGGLLIFHDRYYAQPEDADAVIGRNVFHPIRLTQAFLDHFLSDFDIIFNNCEGETTIGGWMRRNKGERGYYVIARKKIQPEASNGIASH